jgi:kumamolisin
MESTEVLVEIPNTHREPWPGAQPSGSIDAAREVVLTFWLRPKQGGAFDPALVERIGRTPPLERTYLTRRELIAASDADPDERAAVEAFCQKHGMTIVASVWRSLVVKGALGSLVATFEANVDLFLDVNGHHFRHRAGSVKVPLEIAGYVRAVFGLLEWPHSLRLKPAAPGATPALSAAAIATRYAFPSDVDGAGQTVGVLQLGGSFRIEDFRACMQWQGVSTADPSVRRIDDASQPDSVQTGKDVELALDTQIVGALAPGAKIVVYDAPNHERGFLDAIRTALLDESNAPGILSISFGWSERIWTPVALELLADLAAAAALLGVTIVCASGDFGAHPDPQDGRLHVEAPASVPYVLACGATVIDPETDGESAWPKSTGGFSDHFPPPSWQRAVPDVAQAAAVAPGRGVPDVAAQNDPGYPIVFDGVRHRAEGTSAVAPMWAALTARLNQRLGVRAGFFAPLLYGAATAPGPLREVTQGNNGSFEAAAGWNPCTGLGVPDAVAIERVLRAGQS